MLPPNRTAATAQVERAAMVDWDVHHGNGAQEIFWEDPFLEVFREMPGQGITNEQRRYLDAAAAASIDPP